MPNAPRHDDHGFPNLFILDGPQSPSAFYSPALLVEQQARWVGEVIERPMPQR